MTAEPMRIVGSPWLPRRMVVLLFVLVANLLLGGFLVFYYFDVVPLSYGATGPESVEPRASDGDHIDLSTLNVRMSTRAIRPPEGAVQRTVALPGLRGARPLYGEPARAAILEDDARRRVVILSADDAPGSGGTLQAYLLHDFEIERYLPEVTACANVRRCAQDRTPATGGLACIAVCLVEALRS